MCHQEVEATTADVLIAFQKAPGVDADSIINGGDAVLVGSDRPVRPQGDGYYGLRMEEGSTCQLTFLGTTYLVRHIQGDVAEPEHDDDICIAAWDTLGPNDQNSGVGYGMQNGIQRRLQLLGYYTGRVDGTMGRKTEEAILQFQADNELRTDGVVGPTTRARLNTVTTDHTVADGTHIIRRPLVRFERAPHQDNATATSGRPWGRAPDPDCRGTAEVSAVGIDLTGPVVSMARETPFRVKLVRECIANDVILVATSENEELVEVESPDPLPNDRQIILRLRTGHPMGRDPRHTSIKIHIRRGLALTEIASLQVVVLPLIVKEIRPYWVTIDGADHVVSGTNFTGAMAPVGTQELINQALDVANEILWPHGVRFRRLAWREKEVTLPQAGQITWASVNQDYRTIMQTNDTDGNATEDDKLNLHVVRHIETAFGISYSTKRYENWPLVGVVVRSSGGYRNTDAVDIGRTIAHELGHCMGLANNFVNPPHSHVEDDPSAANKKKDIWSLRRLMCGGWPADVRAGDAWAHNNGYGDRNKGSMMSVRNLPADRTDNECYNARSHAASRSFYRNP